VEPDYGREGLRNTMNNWWPIKKHQCYTWINEENKSWIAHIYVSNKFLQYGHNHWGSYWHEEITYKSDHRMVNVKVKFTTMVGRIEGMSQTQKIDLEQSKQLLKKNNETYRTLAQNREDKRNENKKA
jgi:hypothetical protein